MATNVSTPDIVAAPASINFAAFSGTELTTFIDRLLSDTWLNNTQLLFEAPIENIISIRRYPISIPMLSYNYATENDIVTLTHIVVNRVTFNNVENAIINNRALKLIDMGGVQIPTGDSFLDYAPYTNYELYLPFLGFVKLDTDLITGKYLNVQYAIDLHTGIATAYIQVKPAIGSPDSEYVIIDVKEMKIGIEIPICGGAMAEVAKSMLTTGVKAGVGAVGLVGGAVSAGMKGETDAVGALSSASNFAASTSVSAISAGQQHVVKGQTGTGFNNLYGPKNMYLIKTQVKADIPTSFDKLYGRLARTTCDMDDISTGSGFFSFEQFHLEGFPNATKAELNMIENALKEGVIL